MINMLYCLAVGVINMDGQRMQADTGELLQGTSGRREIDLLWANVAEEIRRQS